MSYMIHEYKREDTCSWHMMYFGFLSVLTILNSIIFLNALGLQVNMQWEAPVCPQGSLWFTLEIHCRNTNYMMLCDPQLSSGCGAWQIVKFHVGNLLVGFFLQYSLQSTLSFDWSVVIIPAWDFSYSLSLVRTEKDTWKKNYVNAWLN